MECSDGSGISSRVYNGREDGVMGSLAARRVAEGDRAGVWEAVIVDLFPGVAIRWDSSSSSASLAVGADAFGTRGDIERHCGPSIGPLDGWVGHRWRSGSCQTRTFRHFSSAVSVRG